MALGYSPAQSAPSGAGGSIVDRHFDYLRQQQEANINSQQQQNKDALDRKAASQGMAGSGAFIKLQDQNNQASDNAKTNAINDVEGQRALALGQMAQGDKQLEFQYKQLEANQAEGAANRAFQSSENQSNRVFQSSESAQERGFNKDLFDKEMVFKNRVQSDQNSFMQDQIDLAWKQQKLDTKVSDFNMNMAQQQFDKKDMIENFFSMYGYDTRNKKVTGGPAGTESLKWSTY